MNGISKGLDKCQFIAEFETTSMRGASFAHVAFTAFCVVFIVVKLFQSSNGNASAFANDLVVSFSN